MIKSLLIPSLVAVGLLAGAEARADVRLVDSAPPAGAEVVGAKVELHLRYDGRVDVRGAHLSLKGPGGARSLPPLSGADGAELVARADGLGPGRYILFWDVPSADGKVSRGQLPFIVINP